MVVSTESVFDAIEDPRVLEYEHAVVYGDADREQLLHEGAIRLLPNGWIALPSDRLLSPDAVHHVDRVPE